MKDVQLLAGRVLLAHIFILAGINKLGAGYAGTQGYMESLGVTGMLLPAVIALEIGGGLAILLGLLTRYSAWALAAFTVIAAVIFHSNFDDQMQSIMFMKNFAIAGGLLALAAAGSGRFALDKLLFNKHGGQHVFA